MHQPTNPMNQQTYVDNLIKDLRNPKWQVRKEAAYRLGCIGPGANRAIPELINAIYDSSDEVRDMAVFAISEIKLGDFASSPAFVALLNAPDAMVRRCAVECIDARQDDNDVILAQSLIKMIDDPEAEVQHAVLFKINQTPFETSAAKLPPRDQPIDYWLAVQKQDDWFLRAQASFALIQFRDVSLPFLQGSVRDSNAAVRRATVLALGFFGARSLPVLMQAIKDPNTGVRHALALVLGKIQAPGAIQALLQIFQDSDSSVRVDAIFSFGTLGRLARECARALMNFVADADWLVRAETARALGTTCEQTDAFAVKQLIKFLRDPIHRVRMQALSSLQTMFPHAENPLQCLYEEIADKDRLVCFTIDEVLENYLLRQEPASLVSSLATALKHENVTVRCFAACAFETLALLAVEATPALVEALNDESEEVRMSAITVLEAIGASPQVPTPLLIKCLQDNNKTVRSISARLLREKGSESIAAIPALSEALRDPNSMVQLWAAIALAHIDPRIREGIPRLREAVMNAPDAHLRRYALTALEHIGPDLNDAPAFPSVPT